MEHLLFLQHISFFTSSGWLNFINDLADCHAFVVFNLSKTPKWNQVIHIYFHILKCFFVAFWNHLHLRFEALCLLNISDATILRLKLFTGDYSSGGRADDCMHVATLWYNEQFCRLRLSIHLCKQYCRLNLIGSSYQLHWAHSYFRVKWTVLTCPAHG